MKIRNILLTVTGILICNYPLLAEEVILKNGKVMRGEIVGKESGFVMLKTDTGHAALAKVDIREIRKRPTNLADPKKQGTSTNAGQVGASKKPERTPERTPARPVPIEKPDKIREKRTTFEQRVSCPPCDGSGMAVWLPCLQCNSSNRPGYRYLGSRYVLCDRCYGRAKLPGAKCGVCRGQGKAYLSRVPPRLGGTQKPPRGYDWCAPCKGRGVSSYLDCNQCKRSKYPGYNFHGASLSICNRCAGRGNIPESACVRCKGQGRVLQAKSSK